MAFGPLTRTTARAPRPGGAAIATIVSVKCRSLALLGTTVRSHRGFCYLEGLAGFENAHVGSSGVFGNQRAKPVDRVVRAGRHVVERSPVIRNQVPRPQAREELQRVFAGEVSLAKRFALEPGRI